jgi:uncharacterized cupredoxin-like copper-binding protein
MTGNEGAVRRRIAATAGAAVAVGLVLAFGDMGDRRDDDDACASVPPGGAGEVRVVATEFCFAPATIELAAERPVALVLENRGEAEHDFVVNDLGIRLGADAGGESRTTVSALPAGRYDAVCSIPGHERMGMRGTVVVR